MTRLFLAAGGAGAFTGVALGAFAAHALKTRLDPYYLSVFQTGVQYQLVHSLALISIGVLTLVLPASPFFRAAGFAFIVGILIFSGSLYALALTQVKMWGAVTPLGGLSFLLGWGLFFWASVKTS